MYIQQDLTDLAPDKTRSIIVDGDIRAIISNVMQAIGCTPGGHHANLLCTIVRLA